MSKPSVLPGYAWASYFDPEDAPPDPTWLVRPSPYVEVLSDRAEYVPRSNDGFGSDTGFSRVYKAVTCNVFWCHFKILDLGRPPFPTNSIFIPIQSGPIGLFYGFLIAVGSGTNPEIYDQIRLDFWSEEDIVLGEVEIGVEYEVLVIRTNEGGTPLVSIYLNGELKAQGNWTVGNLSGYGRWLVNGVGMFSSTVADTDGVPLHTLDVYGMAYGTEFEEPLPETPAIIGGWSAVWGTS